MSKNCGWVHPEMDGASAIKTAMEQDNTNQTITNQFVRDIPTDHIMVLKCYPPGN